MVDKKYLETEEKILEKFLLKYQLKHLHQYNAPLTFSFLITERCNLNCKHCFNHDNKYGKNALTLDEYEKLAKSIGFFASGFFCGGEPFLRDDFCEIVSLFQKNCNMTWASTTTNGQFTESILRQTERICINSCSKPFVLNFSLEGYEEQNDYIRGKGTYQKCIETIYEAIKLRKIYHNLQIGIVSTMNTFNEEILGKFFVDISKKINPDVISLLLVRQNPRVGNQIKKVNPQNYLRAKEILTQLFKNGKNGNYNSPKGYYPLAFYDIIEKTLKSNQREFFCYAGIHGAYINYNGDVNPCEILNDRHCCSEPLLMGNLRDYDMNFLELWNSQQAYLVRTQINRHECCKHCTHETEGILPSIYFEPNSNIYKEIIRNVEK